MHHIDRIRRYYLVVLCRYEVEARRLGAWPRVELLPSPFRTIILCVLIYYFPDWLNGVLSDPT